MAPFLLLLLFIVKESSHQKSNSQSLSRNSRSIKRSATGILKHYQDQDLLPHYTDTINVTHPISHSPLKSNKHTHKEKHVASCEKKLVNCLGHCNGGNMKRLCLKKQGNYSMLIRTNVPRVQDPEEKAHVDKEEHSEGKPPSLKGLL